MKMCLIFEVRMGFAVGFAVGFGVGNGVAGGSKNFKCWRLSFDNISLVGVGTGVGAAVGTAVEVSLQLALAKRRSLKLATRVTDTVGGGVGAAEDCDPIACSMLSSGSLELGQGVGTQVGDGVGGVGSGVGA